MKSNNGTAKSRVLCLAGITGLLWCTVPVWAAQVAGTQASVERTLESLSIDGKTYTNVRVFQKTPTDIMFRHDGGITGAKVQQLDNPTLRRLGYEIVAPQPTTKAVASAHMEAFPALVPSTSIRWGLSLLLTGVITLIVGVCLYTGYVFRLICLKSGVAPGFTVWLPFLQAFPLLRAARMSWAWVVALASLTILLAYAAFRVPEHTLVLGGLLAAAFVGLAAVWSIRICHACGKSSVFALFLLLPGLNCLALVYLAGSK
jgi:hypothetical protein